MRQAPIMKASLNGLNPLTPRELEVLSLIAMGHSNDNIGLSLTITERTVGRHIGNIISKLGPLPKDFHVRVWLILKYGEIEGLSTSFLAVSNKPHICFVFDPILKCVDCGNLVEVKEKF